MDGIIKSVGGPVKTIHAEAGTLQSMRFKRFNGEFPVKKSMDLTGLMRAEGFRRREDLGVDC